MMKSSEIRKIRQAAAKATTIIIDVFEKELPENLQDDYIFDDAFEFFYSCVAHSLITELNEWKAKSLLELDED